MQEEENHDGSDEEEAPELTQWEAIGWLAILTVWVSILSGYLVNAIQVKFVISLKCIFLLILDLRVSVTMIFRNQLIKLFMFMQKYMQ